MEEKVFKLKGKTLAIIDWANVYGWHSKLKWEVNPKKLFEYLKSYSEIYDIRFYFGVEKGNEKSEKFQEEIKNIGYTLISKEVKWVPVSLDASYFKKFNKELAKVIKKPIYRRKCDFDCEITLDIMKNINNYEGVILFSGDGDYAVVIKELIARNKQIIVVALKNAMGKEYSFIKKGVFICNIKKLNGFV